MAKLSLTSLANLQNEQTAVAALNANSAATETALENTLSRDGTSPNQMEALLDMNSNRIVNLPEPSGSDEPVRKQDLEAAELTGGAQLLLPLSPANGGTGISSYTAGDMIYSLATTTLSKLAKGTAGQVLASGNAPQWVPSGTSGQILVSQGSTSVPSWQNQATVTQTNLPIKQIKIAIMGDSRAATTGLTGPGITSFEDYLVTHMPMLANATIDNYAVPSQTLTTANQNYAITAGASLPATNEVGYLILVYHGQINDWVVDGTTYTASFATLQTLIGKAEADGWNVILGTEPKASSVSGAGETNRTNYNNLITSTYITPNIVRPDWIFSNTADTNDYVDGTHFTADAAERTAGLIAVAMGYKPVTNSTAANTRLMGKLGIGTRRTPTYTFEIAGDSSTGFPLLSITDLDTSGHEFWLYARAGSVAQDFSLFDQTASVTRWVSKANGDFRVPSGSIISSGYVKSTSTTVSSLPAAATAGAGARSMVSDSNSTTFMATVAGGGANIVPVVSDGTNWKIG